jgi:hypothetical protein
VFLQTTNEPNATGEFQTRGCADAKNRIEAHTSPPEEFILPGRLASLPLFLNFATVATFRPVIISSRVPPYGAPELSTK